MKKFVKSFVINLFLSGFLVFIANTIVYADISLRNDIPLDRAVNVPPEYSYDMSLLVSSLTAGLDDCSKAKALHDWIALNISYDTECYFSGIYKPMDPESVFARKTAVCQGYAELYKYFCDLAGLNCVMVKGTVKGYSYPTYGILEKHAWNMLTIDGMAYLVDVTWDGGYVSGTEFVRSYRTDYFFLHPNYFIYTHIPDSSEYQFINPPVTEEEFEDLPFIEASFFDLGLQTVFPLNYSNKVTNYFEARLIVPENIYLKAELKTKEGQSLPGYAYVERYGNDCTVKVTVPYSGTDYYLLTVSAGYGEVLQYKLYM